MEKYGELSINLVSLCAENLLSHPFIVVRRQCQVNDILLWEETQGVFFCHFDTPFFFFFFSVIFPVFFFFILSFVLLLLSFFFSLYCFSFHDFMIFFFSRLPFFFFIQSAFNPPNAQVNVNSQRYHLLPITLVPALIHMQGCQGVSAFWKGLGSVLTVRGVTLALEDCLSKFTPWPKWVPK